MSMQLGGGQPPIPNQEPSVQPTGAAQGGPAQAQEPAPPSHQQTVAAVRHFDAIRGELATILRNPALGKSDLKDQIIDGVTQLVARQIISPGQAVAQLSQVPEEPLQQRKWIQTQMDQATQAEMVVVEHYRQGKMAAGNMGVEADHGRADDHMSHMAAVHANYGGKR